MENEILIARFNKLLDQKLKGSSGSEATAGLAADCQELLKVAELLQQADFSANNPVKARLWEKMLEIQEQQAREHAEVSADELDEDELYQATGGIKPPPEDEPDRTKPS
jgi:hypothetical protein